MTESGGRQPSADLAPLIERLDVLRAELDQIGAAYEVRQINLKQLIIAASPLWDEKEKVEDKIYSAYRRLAGINDAANLRRDRDRERRDQLAAMFELPFGYQHSLRDYELTAKISWFCTGRGTHDPLRVRFTQPHEVRGADRRTRQLLVLRDVHDGIRRLEAVLRKEVTGRPGPPRAPDKNTAEVPHREHVEMVCFECRRSLRLGGRQLNRAGHSGLTDIDISRPLPF